MLCLILIFALVSAFSIFQLTKVTNFHRLNILHLKYVNQLDQSLFGPSITLPSKNAVIQIVHNIREQPLGCLNQINMFDRWFMNYIGTETAISLCEEDIELADAVLLKLESIQSNYLMEVDTLFFMREASEEFTRHSKEFELHITKIVDKVVQFSLWLFIPVAIILMILSLVIYHFVTSYSNSIREKNNALTKAEKENWQMAYFDSLTGLPNRNLFNERLEKAITKAKRNNEKIVVMFLDLDRFKHVNDTYGHVAGDKLIYESSLRFLSQLRESDTLARFGGDEFVILLQGLRNDEDVGKIANKIIKSVNEPFMILDNHVSVGTSIGIAIYPKDGRDAETLLKNADVAMYVSKERGKNQYCIHDETIREKAARLALIESRLKFAIQENSLSLNYQPVVDLNTMKIKGAEVLLRWNDKELGFVSPDEFIPVAEDSGQIIGIGEWVFETACEKLKEWRIQYDQDIYLSVNISGRQLKDSNFIKFIEDTLAIYKLPYNAINLEITENVFYSNDTRSVETIKLLSTMGIVLLLDDFGTGYSSLSTLTSLPFDFVKIDKSFLMHGSEKNFKTSSTIIDMAKNFNMGVIAEGVEHNSTVQFLLERKCDFAQGYLFAKPCTENEIDFLKDYSSLFEQTNNEEITSNNALRKIA